ncbi:MAG TPA: hypothetical protein VIK97_18960, partial [Casimicrobiaceae bacterium]
MFASRSLRIADTEIRHADCGAPMAPASGGFHAIHKPGRNIARAIHDYGHSIALHRRLEFDRPCIHAALQVVDARVA